MGYGRGEEFGMLSKSHKSTFIKWEGQEQASASPSPVSSEARPLESPRVARPFSARGLALVSGRRFCA